MYGIHCVQLSFDVRGAVDDFATKASSSLVHINEHTAGAVALRVNVDVGVSRVTPVSSPRALGNDVLVSRAISVIADSDHGHGHSIASGGTVSAHVGAGGVRLKVSKGVEREGNGTFAKCNSHCDAVGLNLRVTGLLKRERVHVGEGNLFSFEEVAVSGIYSSVGPHRFFVGAQGGESAESSLYGTRSTTITCFGLTVDDHLDGGLDVSNTGLDGPSSGGQVGSSGSVRCFACFSNFLNGGNHTLIAPVNGSGVLVEGAEHGLVTVRSVCCKFSG